VEKLLSYYSVHGPAILLLLSVAVLACALALLVVGAKLRRFSRPLTELERAGRGEAFAGLLKVVESDRQRLDRLEAELAAQESEGSFHLKGVGLVRYDAFEDVGGKQSYSLCLLDRRGDGIIVTYLTGRNSTRSYAVTVEGGKAGRELSEEEARALEQARERLPLPRP